MDYDLCMNALHARFYKVKKIAAINALINICLSHVCDGLELTNVFVRPMATPSKTERDRDLFLLEILIACFPKRCQRLVSILSIIINIFLMVNVKVRE